jgi:hypothetical protein
MLQKRNIGVEAKLLRERDMKVEAKLLLRERNMKVQAEFWPDRGTKVVANLLRKKDTKMEARLSQENDTEKETEKEEEEDKRRVEVLCTRDQPYPLYDKTIRHIGGLSYGSLRRYKNYFLETGNVKVPERFVGNEALVKRFTDFLHNDE